MESGGGMVAIVQGAKHAGLTVTVLPEKHSCCKRKYFVLDMGVKTTRGCKSNVETNTEWISKNSSTPLWDIRYDSGYPFANCLRSPSSQKRSLYHQLPHHMVSFMKSLRQYPKETSSADFIQEILDYTCTKNHTKKHSRKSSLRKSISQHTHRIGKKQENLQTHKINTSSRRCLDRSASAIGKWCSSQEEVLNYTYDYLKNTSFIHRRTDVRYLTEMKRALKDRLREMIECKSMVCPTMQSRYVIHKRHCGSPKNTSDVSTNNTETQVTDSKAVPNLAYGTSSISPKHSLHKACFCQSTPCVCKKSHELKVLNEIKDWINDIPVYPNFSEDDKAKQDQMLKELTNTLNELLKESNFNFKAKKEILKFFKALPMWHPSDPKEDALFKEKLAEHLIEKFGKAAEAILEEEIAREIRNLPLDSKHIDKEDIKRMTDKFVNKLKPIVANSPTDEEEYKEALKSELLDLLQDLPLRYESQKPETKSEIADKFADKLRTIKLPVSKQTTTKQQEREIENKVSDIFKGISELSFLEDLEKKVLTQFIKDKMGDYGPKDLEDFELQQEIQKEIKEWVDNSEISGRIDSKTKDILTQKVMQELQEGFKSDDEDTLNLVKNWVQGIPELSGGDETENKKALRELAIHLNQIQISGEDPENIQFDMRETIADWLQNMLRNNKKRLSFTTQENFVNELVKKVNDVFKQKSHMQREDPDNIMYDDIVEWIKNIPGIDSNINLNQTKAIEDLMITLNDIRSNCDDELAELQATDAINNFVEHLSETPGVEIDPKKWKVLEKKLLGKMKQAPKQRKHWKKQNGYGTSTQKVDVSGRYYQSPDLSPTRDLIKKWAQRLELSEGYRMENNKALQDLAIQLDEIQKNGEDPKNIQIDMKETIADWLQNMLRKNNRRLSSVTQENLVRELVKNLNDALKQRRHMQREAPNIMYGDVVEWIKGIPGKDSNITIDQSNAIEDLMNTLNDIRSNSNEKLVETETRGALNNFIEHLSETTGVEIDVKKRKVLEQKLLGKMKQAPQQRKQFKKQNGYRTSTQKVDVSGRYSQSSDLSHTRDLIRKWVQNLQLSLGERMESKKALQDLATQLDEIQISGEDPENIQTDMKEIIADWLQNMLRKSNRRLSSGIQENLVSELVNNINDALKQRRHMQREEPDVMYGDVVEWINDVPGMDSNTKLDQSNVMEHLMNTLKDIKNNSDAELVEIQTRNAINNFIKHISQTTGVEIDPKKRKVLEQKLLGKLKQAPQQRKHLKKQNGTSTPKTYTSERYPQVPDLLSIRDLVKKWAENLELSESNRMEYKKALQDLATQLDEIQTSGEDPENIQIDMKETIADWLHSMLRKYNKRLSFATQENLVSELVKKVNEAPKQRRHMQREEPNISYGDVVEWIKEIPGIDSNIELNQSNAIEDLMNTLNYIRGKSNQELVETETRGALNNFIEHLSETTGVEIHPKERKVLEQKLLEKMKQALQQRKHWDTQNRFGFSTPKSYAKGYSMSPDMSPIRDVSPLDRQTEIDEYINTLYNLIDSWMKRLELTLDSAEQRNLVSDIASDIVDRHKYLQVSKNETTEADELEHLKYQIFRRLNKFNVEDLPRILSKVTDFNKALESIKVPELTKPLNRLDLTRNINNLINSLKIWLDNIPSDLARPYNEPYSDEVFMDLAKKLAEHKDSINHYQMKNEILQWFPKLFTNLSTNTLNNLADSLKKHIMINDLAQSLAQDETAGLIYRQMLWDTISKTLPSIHMKSADDLQAFDLLKERLVDAFINLHYFANDMVALDKFRTKLFNEVSKFCNEYLRRFPESPMNSEEIGKNLYNALRQVSVPDLGTVRSELEQVRLKEDILDWLPEVPLDLSKNIDPEINAMATSLAKRLRGLEKEKQQDPNKDNEMKQEITKWLRKLPLRNKEQMNLQDFADKLMAKLKSSDKSRTLSASKVGKYDDYITPIGRSSQYPQSTLSVEDRAHLNIIRRRLDYSRGKRTKYSDSSVSPPPRESVIQTGMDTRLEEGSIQTGPSMYERGNIINRRVSPQVIIKEYYWDSTGSNISMREITSDARQAPCSKATQTTAQSIRICQRTPDLQTEQTLNTYPRSQVDKICNKKSCSVGTLAERNTCMPPKCYLPEEKQINHRTRPESKVDYIPEDKRTYQTTNLPSEIIRRKSKVDSCCNCGQRIYTKCRGRHNAYRPHCNLTCLKYCPKLNSLCPYPSNLYFRKEF